MERGGYQNSPGRLAEGFDEDFGIALVVVELLSRHWQVAEIAECKALLHKPVGCLGRQQEQLLDALTSGQDFELFQQYGCPSAFAIVRMSGNTGQFRHIAIGIESRAGDDSAVL